MTEIEKISSDSDLSTDSWTFLEDENVEHVVEVEDPEKGKVAESDKVNKNDGFLTFDEFLQEHLLEHDYEHEEKLNRLKKIYKNKLKRGFRKFKAKSYGISVLISILLGLSAFATLLSTISQPVASNALEEFQQFPSQNNVVYSDVFQSFNDTLKELDTTTSKNVDFFGPLKYNSTLDLQETKPPVKPTPKGPKALTKNFACLRRPIQKPKPISSKWLILKDVLLDINFHALISFVMTNVYLLSLLAECVRKPNHKVCQDEKFLSDLEQSDDITVRKYLFKELPFWNAEFLSKDHKKKKSPKKPPQQAASCAFADRKKMINSILFKSCHYLSQQCLPPIVLPPEEAGKSECQRRFEELDKSQKKFDHLKQQQRDRIKLLKQKFRNEVAYIKDTEEEANARAEKINRTSQLFIKKLKSNREKYLVELRKVKELKQRFEKKKNACRDVAVGGYSVSLPVVYDFGERFKAIRERFQMEEGQQQRQLKFN